VLAPEDQLRARLRQISRTWSRYGFRRAWALLRLEGWVVNRKRVLRLWREEGLKVRPWAPKWRRLGTSTAPAQRLRAERPQPRLGDRLHLRRQRRRPAHQSAVDVRRIHP
jgi:hypothetical protein